MIAFFCRTPIHIFRTIQLKYEMFEKEKVDVYVFSSFNGSSNIVQRLKKINIFENVYYIDDSTYMKGRHLVDLKACVIKSEFKKILSEKKYRELFTYNIYGPFNEVGYNVLKKNNIDCKKDVEIVQNIDFGSTAAAFASGLGDFTVEFEPSATAIESENKGYIAASLGVDSGYVPYTAYCAKKSFLKNNPEIIQSFTNAIQKGLEFVNSHNSSEIAAVIAPQFKETDIQTLTKIVERYKSQDTWKNDTIFEESSFSLLTDILKQAGELDENVPYNKLVTTDFSKKAVK